MKVSYNWLKQYVDTDLSPEEMGKILTDTGLEVEGIAKVEAVKGGLEGVFIGEVLTCEQHPDADRLKVTTVSVGGEPLQIVCGAPNVAAGKKVIVATVGCKLYPSPEEEFKIKKSKIRGVESLGMLCAEDELGLGQSHEGILLIDSDVKVGTPAATYFGLEADYEIEIGLTPNRSDAMGHIGVARDLVAFLNVHQKAGLSLKFPDVSAFKVENNDLPISVQVENNDLSPRYMGTSIKGVKVEASPAWLQKRLRSIGLSPINNVVDVTNFVMHELGTPLHGFDAAKLNGKIVVKTANEGDKFTTLDDVERTLGADQLMITNGTDHLCIAGVFGGSTSGISDTTTDIFLESAYFNPVSVRKTSKFHGLNTDSSFRFERGVDPNLTEYALKRAALLIQEVAGGTISMDVVDTNSKPIENVIVEFSYDRSNRLIGTEVPMEMVKAIFKELDIQIISESNGIAQLEIPAYRIDVTREADVVEEILRIFGFNNVPIPEKLNTSLPLFTKPDVEKLQTTISEMLVGMGCIETMNNSLTKSEYAEKIGGEVVKSIRNVEMLNPLSLDLNVMRQTLVFNALETVVRNQNRQNPDLKLFEFGKIYHKFDEGYAENRRLIIALSGKRETENWNSNNNSTSYYTIKGTTRALFERIGLAGMLKESSFKTSLLQDGVQLSILKRKVGEIGWITPQLKKHFGIKQDVFIADLDWDAIIDSLKFVKVKYTELPKTFAVRRDFSLLLDTKITFAEIEQIAKASDKKILKEVGLFDVYEGKNLEEGKKSYAVSFKFQDLEKTLKDKQVDAVMEKIRSQLESKLGAQLR
ncbi:MAG: phenylalanine--tRNA ligase subunit beta [Crocinitomicaceae bacterium]|nr:phenylalanine--tRNA ligase subunit beta [Flavobacteriales bacterium]NQZ37447.1 phenylalanine--tRNA ligase subunit beta [Crocinitomicaceae bacterium]